MNASEKVLATAIRKNVHFEAWLNVALFILAGVLGPQINPHISLGESVVIAVVGLFVTQPATLRSFEHRYPPNIKRSMKSGFILGVLRGVPLGIIAGLHGGIEDIGFWWSVMGCTVLFAVPGPFVNARCDRMLAEAARWDQKD
jgi:hypothetical protein